VIACGTVSTGGCESATVMVKDVVAVFERVSVAVHFTFVEPIRKVVPDAGAQLGGTGPSTTSTAMGVGHVTLAPCGPLASRVKLAGTLEKSGGVVS
jgi:hypothetical protein